MAASCPIDTTTTRDLEAWFVTTVDIKGCSRREIIVPLYGEYEKAGLLFQEWPAAVQAQTMKYLRSFGAENPTRVIVALTHAVAPDSDGGLGCITIVHHKAK